MIDLEGKQSMKKDHCKLFIATVLVMLSTGSVLGQDAKLVDAAKKEGGKVVVYGSLENDTMVLISAAFKKKTGLDVDFWRDSANKVTDRVAAEDRKSTRLNSS